MKQLISEFFSRLGYVFVKKHEFVRYKRFYRDRKRHINLFNRLNFDLVLDVGAHEGGFVNEIRSIGYKREIFSFEPVIESFEILSKKSLSDNSWRVFNYALGETEDKLEINISNNFVSSSILSANENHIKAAPDSISLTKQIVDIKTVDRIFSELELGNYKSMLLKIDTQGFEQQVLNGAMENLNKFKAIKLELSNIHLYKDSFYFYEISEWLYQRGFNLVSIENGFYDKNNFELLQFDGLFLNKNSPE